MYNYSVLSEMYVTFLASGYMYRTKGYFLSIAEVEFHADALLDWKAGLRNWPIAGDWYQSAIRSEMGVGEEDSGFYDQYYDLESNIVKEQADIHGQY